MRSHNFFRIGLCANVLFLIAVGIAGMSMLIPSTEAVRVRNAFVAFSGTPTDFQWTPATRPYSFLQESAPESGVFDQVVRELGVADPSDATAFERSLRLAEHLVTGPQRGGAIQRDAATTYHTIVGIGGGYCADFTQVFNALGYAAQIPVREWGMSFDGFGGWGHAFNEIYDDALGQWVFIDSFNSFYVVDDETGRPLSALEFRERLYDADAEQSIRTVHIVPKEFGFRDESTMLEYFVRGRDQFFLIWGNNVLSYDASPLVKAGSRVSRSVETGLGILAGVQPKLRLLETGTNREMIEDLYVLKEKVIWLICAGVVGGLLLIWQCWRLLGYRREAA